MAAFALTLQSVHSAAHCTYTLSTSPTSVRIRARVAYDGSQYKGWQFQASQPTIQAILEDNIARKVGYHARVIGASRTDTGVHARGQAFHIDIPSEKAPCNGEELRKFQFTLNQMLPSDIRVKNMGIAPFVTVPSQDLTQSGSNPTTQQRPWHAMFSARGKLYTYRISTALVFDPMQRLYRHHEWRAARYGFHLDLLRASAAKFVGAHDFSAFTNVAKVPRGMVSAVQVNPVRTVDKIEVVDEGDGCYRIEFYIDGALYKMIRNIVGTMLDVACGNMNLCVIDDLFNSKNRSIGPKSAPANGLCLEEVFYDDWTM